MPSKKFSARLVLSLLALVLLSVSTAQGAEPKKLLLIGQGPDGHAYGQHMFDAGVKIWAELLKDVEGLEVTVANGDEPWADGPELIEQSDAVVLFVTQGARWIQRDPRRYQAMQRLAQRGGGIMALHFGIGTKDAEFIDGFLQLVGGCHGGPDRKYQYADFAAKIADKDHPISRGLADFPIHDEYYYQLKFVQPAGTVKPLIQATIDNQTETVGWTWERPDGGRSFGYSGFHYHELWRNETYRRLVAQGSLWVAGVPIPEGGLKVDIDPELLKLPPEPENWQALGRRLGR